MSRQIQLRRGTTAENDVFIGAEGEITIDTETNMIRVHDGKTKGGTMMIRADYVVSLIFQILAMFGFAPSEDGTCGYDGGTL